MWFEDVMEVMVVDFMCRALGVVERFYGMELNGQKSLEDKNALTLLNS